MQIFEKNVFLGNDSNMVLAPCNLLMQIREIIMWQLATSSGLSHFCGK